MKRIFTLLLVFSMCLCMAGCGELLGSMMPDASESAQTVLTDGNDASVVSTDENKTSVDVTAEFDAGSRLLEINYLDVGQGDSIFIVLPDGKTLLIDASISSQSDKIISYIKNEGYSSLDYVVATHPHADHIGGMTAVLKEFEVGTMYMPDVTTNTKTFENMLDIIEEKEISVKRAKAGVTICEDDSFSVKILAPNSEGYSDLNDYSAVLRIEYGQRAFMFMGDAHVLSEEEITVDVTCDVVKVGHHGSRTSSGENFVKRTGAKYAVFSLGEGNDYGHPHAEALERWQNSGAEILRTDLMGNIVVNTDGVKMAVTSNRGTVTDNTPETQEPSLTETPEPVTEDPSGEEYNWVLNTNSKKIHKDGCSSLKNMSESNKVYSNKTISELEGEGYTTCKICHPAD